MNLDKQEEGPKSKMASPRPSRFPKVTLNFLNEQFFWGEIISYCSLLPFIQNMEIMFKFSSPSKLNGNSVEYQIFYLEKGHRWPKLILSKSHTSYMPTKYVINHKIIVLATLFQLKTMRMFTKKN